MQKIKIERNRPLAAAKAIKEHYKGDLALPVVLVTGDEEHPMTVERALGIACRTLCYSRPGADGTAIIEVPENIEEFLIFYPGTLKIAVEVAR
jgi:hypothetical protein